MNVTEFDRRPLWADMARTAAVYVTFALVHSGHLMWGTISMGVALSITDWRRRRV